MKIKLTDIANLTSQNAVRLPDWVYPTIYNHPNADYEGSEGPNVVQGRTYTIEYLYGNGGNDIMYGNGGLDHLYVGEGHDTLYANGPTKSEYPRAIGRTTLEGEAGNDTLVVTESAFGKFALSGGIGDDKLIVKGDGLMTLNGGEGHDTFTFTRSFQGNATIEDFQIGTDHLKMEMISSVSQSAAGNATLHTVDGGNVELAGISVGTLYANWAGILG